MALDPDILQWTILVIDSDAANISAADQVLRFYGANVHTAASGREGLDMLAHLRPTIILLAITLPDISGWDVLKAIRGITDKGYLPTIAMATLYLNNYHEKLLKAGFDGYILKPWPVQALIDTINLVATHPSPKNWPY